MNRNRLVILILGLACMLAFGPARADVSLTRLFCVSRAVGGKEFLNPQSVFVDRSRSETYVADTGNGRIDIFSKDGYPVGGFYHRIDGVTDGSTEPVGVAVDSRGRVYVTDSTSHSISVYDYRGRLGEKLEVSLPGGDLPLFGRMAVDASDNLYVVVRNRGMVCVLAPSGALKLKIGGNGTFEMLSDVAVDSKGLVYALDTLGQTAVQVFDRSGRQLFGFGRHAEGEGNLAHPTAVDVDEAGRIWVVDSFAQIVDVYDSRGAFLTDFGGYFLPVDLAYVPGAKRLYVLEKNGRRLSGQEVSW